jgi:hypothetical protein
MEKEGEKGGVRVAKGLDQSVESSHDMTSPEEDKENKTSPSSQDNIKQDKSQKYYHSTTRPDRPEQTRQQVSEQDTRKIHSHVQKTQQVTRWGQEEGSEGGKGQGWVEVTCVDGKRGT